MPKLVPTISVLLSRDHPNKRKDKEGNPQQMRHQPKIGEAFDFTDEEVKHIRAADPNALREPVNEGGQPDDEDPAERAAREAAESAAKTKGAAGDAANVARTAAIRGTGALPEGANKSEPGPDEEDDAL